MIKIEYPDNKPKIRRSNAGEEIFCFIRKKWFVITPEEWVRQNFLLYLINVLNYPASLISVEKGLMIGELKKRYDIVVYAQDMQPFMVVECKEMEVALNESTILQVLRYNIELQANYLIVTNGVSCAAFQKLEADFKEIEFIPYHREL